MSLRVDIIFTCKGSDKLVSRHFSCMQTIFTKKDVFLISIRLGVGIMKPEDECYVRKRGFTIARECPAIEGCFPYVALCGPGLDEDQVVLYMGNGTGAGMQEFCHPVTNTPDELADMIAGFIAANRCFDGVLFATQEGKPIPVFVEDQRWVPAVEALVRKYDQVL